MSAHNACTCPDRKYAKKHHWVVTMRNCNYSAFNGYHYTPSDYSQVHCTGKHCNGTWRSKSAYVTHLPDMKLEDVNNERYPQE